MSEKIYSEAFGMIPMQCSKASQDNISHCQQLYSYPNVPVNNFSPHMEMYNPMQPQTYNRNQAQGCMYTDQQIDVSWVNDIDKNMKLPDKIDLIELTSKDLSPASYCSNIELLLPDYYKTGSKEATSFCNKFENSWLPNANFNMQRNIDYPSCAQVSGNGSLSMDKTERYCSIQKDFDPVLKHDMFSDPNNALNKCFSSKTSHIQSHYSYNCYHNKDENQVAFDSVVDQLYSQGCSVAEVPFQPIDIEHHSEESNDESDIIVEESDDDITDISEVQERRFFCQSNKCVICNLMYTPIGTQFYFLTIESPLTMSSQKPVFYKIIEMIGPLSSKLNYLCNQCLGLINTIDHLQFKLESFRNEFCLKFKKTCHENNVNVLTRKVFSRKHVNIRKLPKYKCRLCKKIVCLQKVCHNHLQKHRKKFLCELCGKVFTIRKHFTEHLRKHKHKPKKIVKIEPFKCFNCPKYFRTKSNLKEHENYCLGLLPYECKIQDCDKKFASTSKLKNHIRLKHDKKFIAICSICNIGFVNVNSYKSHKISHSTDKKFACRKCDKSYKTLSNLNFHMKIHQDKLPFICEICNKGFMRKEYLEAHVNNHKGIKNFLCQVCDKKFVSQKNLDSHLKCHDGTIEKKICNVCGKAVSSGYEEHLRIHSNLFEYECDQCDKKFNTKGTLSKHKRVKHNKDSTNRSEI